MFFLGGGANWGQLFGSCELQTLLNRYDITGSGRHIVLTFKVLTFNRVFLAF